ncbi:MAG: YihY/virulence factor BrkB family protein [Actinobacteria bacterium]|nr:MAG: YihY/virulence factor BrkB family protein [Actinomycetota bacterium]
MAGIGRTARAIDRFQQRHRLTAIPVAVAKKFGEDQAGSLSALIAYYGFFSLFPLILVFVTIAGFILGATNRLAPAVFDSFPLIGSAARAGTLRGSGLALAVGLVMSTWAGLGVIQYMQAAMSRVWGVPVRDQAGFANRLLRSLIMLVAFGLWLAATSLLSGLAAAGSTSDVVRALVIAALLVLNLGLYLCAFRILPKRRLSWRDVLPGAVAGALFWTGLHLLGGYYVAHQIRGASQVYGTFAVVIGLLSWLYLGAQGSLLAAELNVVLRERLWPRSLLPPPPARGDEQAVRSAAERESRRPENIVDVRLEDHPSSPGHV